MTSLTGTTPMAKDLFGEEGLGTFRTVALAALKEQKVEYTLITQAAELEQLRNENTKLKKEKEDITTAMDANIEDRERVINHKTAQIQELLQEKMELEQALGDAQEVAQQEFERIERQASDELNAKDRQVTSLKDKLAELQEFRIRKDELDAEVEEMRHEKTELMAKHDAEVQQLRRQLQEETERLTQEKQDEINRCRAEMQALMQTKLDHTTKRTIEENGQMSTELRYQSRRTEQLLRENQQLSREKKQAMREMQLSLSMQEQMANRVRFYERLFHKMQQREKANLESQSVTTSVTASSGKRQAPQFSTDETETLTPAGGDSVVLGAATETHKHHTKMWLSETGIGTTDSEVFPDEMQGLAEMSKDELIKSVAQCTSIIRQHLNKKFSVQSVPTDFGSDDPSVLANAMQSTMSELDNHLAVRMESNRGIESMKQYNTYLENREPKAPTSARRASPRPNGKDKLGRNKRRLQRRNVHSEQPNQSSPAVTIRKEPQREELYETWVHESVVTGTNNRITRLPHLSLQQPHTARV